MLKNAPSKISIIVTTYNWPFALRAVLNALLAQKTSIPFEIIVADDGSKEETAALVRLYANKTKIGLLHVWQEDLGFRAAAIRNKAIAKASGDYLIFLDGDCIPRENFIARHHQLAELGCFIAGNRVLLNREFTLKVLSEDLPLHQWTFSNWFKAYLKGYCNRISPFLSLALGPLRFLQKHRWQNAKACNLGIWKADLIKVNGFEEKFIGWGYEDSDLTIRLIRAGLKKKEGRYFLPVIHLWHPENDRSRERENWALLKVQEQSHKFEAEKGLDQYQEKQEKIENKVLKSNKILEKETEAETDR